MRIPKPTAMLIGVIISLVLLGGGFFVLQRASRAEDKIPRDVVVSEITDNSAILRWTTAQKTQGVIEYGSTPTALTSFNPETESSTNHQVELTLLSRSTTYYFQISVDGKKYDNGGVPWTFTSKEAVEVEEEIPTEAPKEKPPQAPTLTPIRESCLESDCAKIKTKLGKGCTTQDYFRCIKRLTPTTAQ